jgi:hypothetical protein
MRSELQLQQIYGLGDRLSLSDGTQVQIHHLLLASELTSVFFQSQYIRPFQRYLHDSGVLAHALGRLAMDDLLSGENRFPMTWSEEEEKIRRIKGWTLSEEHPRGSADSARAILKFWTSDLKALAQQLKQQPGMPAPRLYEQPFYKIGRYSFQFPWVVDTSIELDGQSVDGFRVVSREVLEIILRDEKQLLRPIDQLDEESRDSLFPDGFTAERFIAVVESDELWRGICWRQEMSCLVRSADECGASPPPLGALERRY